MLCECVHVPLSCNSLASQPLLTVPSLQEFRNFPSPLYPMFCSLPRPCRFFFSCLLTPFQWPGLCPSTSKVLFRNLCDAGIDAGPCERKAASLPLRYSPDGFLVCLLRQGLYVVLAVFKLTNICLPLPPKCWD